jgi:hypothetical protein
MLALQPMIRLAERWDERLLVREAVMPPFLPSSLRATTWSQQIDFDPDPDFDADGYEPPEANGSSRKKRRKACQPRDSMLQCPSCCFQT